MGIRFRCHHCEHELNLKNFQAGRRGRCPVCSGRFRVPTTSCDFSTPLEEDEQELASSALSADQPGAGRGQVTPSFELKQPTSDLERFKLPAAEGKRPDAAKPSSVAEPGSTTPKPAAAKKLASKKVAAKEAAARKAAARPSATEKPAAEKPATAKASAETAAAEKAAPEKVSLQKTPAAQSQVAADAPTGSSTPAQPTATAVRGRAIPRAIAEAPQAVWYVRPPSGGQFGPADSATFYQWMQENRVAREALVWRDGWPQWMTAGEALEEYYGSRWLLPEGAAAPAEPGGSLAGVPGAGPAQGGGSDVGASELGLAGLGGPGVADASGGAGLVKDGLARDGLAKDSGLAVGAVQGVGLPAGLGGDLQAGSAGATESLPPVRPPARRKRRRTNYALWISVLGIVAIALVVVLITVLMSQ